MFEWLLKRMNGLIKRKKEMNKSLQNQDKKFDQLAEMMSKLMQQQTYSQSMQAQAAHQQAVPQQLVPQPTPDNTVSGAWLDDGLHTMAELGEIVDEVITTFNLLCNEKWEGVFQLLFVFIFNTIVQSYKWSRRYYCSGCQFWYWRSFKSSRSIGRKNWRIMALQTLW